MKQFRGRLHGGIWWILDLEEGVGGVGGCVEAIMFWGTACHTDINNSVVQLKYVPKIYLKLECVALGTSIECLC